METTTKKTWAEMEPDKSNVRKWLAWQLAPYVADLLKMAEARAAETTAEQEPASSREELARMFAPEVARLFSGGAAPPGPGSTSSPTPTGPEAPLGGGGMDQAAIPVVVESK